MSGPIVLELEAGAHYWCRCGKTKNGSFCDGSHKGSGITPLGFNLSEKKQVALCSCHKTTTAPFCNGAHKK